jgi:hypothetical protein
MLMCSAWAENTDNLLSNGNFSNQLNDWTVEDSTKTKHDNNCYAGGTDASGLCKSVRWSSDLGKTISQTITNLQEGYDIDNINVSFTALGCNNEANSSTWCSQGTDYDKVQAVIELYDGTNTETLILEQTLDYNDGTQDYSLSTQTLDSWTTDNTSIDFSITGIDTGDWSGWYAPIVDNINLNLTISETVILTPEPQVSLPQVEDIVEVIEIVEEVEEITLIEGLDLSTELITDVILDIPTDMNMEISVQTVAVIEPIVEIQEETMQEEANEITTEEIVIEPTIEIEEPIVIEDTVLEIEEVVEVEEITEIEEIASIDDVGEPEGEVEAETTESNESTSEETEVAESDDTEEQKEKSDEKEEKSESEQETEVAESKNEPKTKAEQKPKQSKSKDSRTVKKSSGIEQIMLPTIYLQKIQETIKIVETISLIQEPIYEQDIDFITSGASIDSIIGDTSGWGDSVVGQRYQYEASSYRRSRQ